MKIEIFTGNNCHADVVVWDGDCRPEDVATAKELFKTKGFELATGESLLGHFSVWGATHAEGPDAHFTPGEIELLQELGEFTKVT